MEDPNSETRITGAKAVAQNLVYKVASDPSWTRLNERGDRTQIYVHMRPGQPSLKRKLGRKRKVGTRRLKIKIQVL